MLLTLREAMKLVEPLKKSKVLAGDQGLDNAVQSVNVMEVPDILEWVRPGELLVTTMYPLRNDAAALETLVPQLADKGLAGLAVTPSDYMSVLPESMVDSANKLGFPIIELPEKVSFIDIIQPITNEILKLQADELRESERLHRQFISLVLGGGSYADIAQGIAHQLQRPVTIVDRFRRVLGEGHIAGMPRSYRAFTRDEEGGDRYLDVSYQPVAKEKIAGSEAERRIVPGPGGSIDQLVCPVMVGPMTLGEIIVWGPLSKRSKSMDLIAIEHGSTVAALKMMESRSIGEVEQRFRNEILDGLLSHDPSDREGAIRLSMDWGHQLVPPYAVIIVAPDFPSESSVSKVRSVEQSNIGSSLHLAKRYIRSLNRGSSFWYQGPRLVVFVPLKEQDMHGAKNHLINGLSSVCNRIGSENDPYTVSMGISPIAHDFDGFRFVYECARQSLDLGPALNSEKSCLVTHYEDLGLFGVLSLSKDQGRLNRFCTENIGALVAYDAQHSADLVRTLRVYLEQNQNGASTAKLLFVHYNTLRYRIKRIKDILDADIENPRQRLAIEVALQILPMVNGANSKIPQSTSPHSPYQ